jgi:DNA-binding response OmpR family regulator
VGIALVDASVLLIEDDAAIADQTTAALVESGCTVWHAETGADARAMVRQARPDVILLDLTLPDVDGLVLCPRLRVEAEDVPIIVCAENADRRERLLAFKLGAEDFVCKPFDLEELQARIEVAARRRARGTAAVRAEESSNGQPKSLGVGTLTIDVPRWYVAVDGRRVHLTPTEFKLLVHLATRAGEMVTREQLAHDVWGDGAMSRSRVIDAYVRRVRHKLGNNGTPQFLPVRGVGYQVVPAA